MSSNNKTFAANHYPLEIFGRKVHILNSCATYAALLQQLVSSSNVKDLTHLVEKQPKEAAQEAAGKINKSFFDLFSPSITTTSQHIPHGQMKRISVFRYLHPNGVKILSAEGVSSTLKAASMPFVTDLITRANKNNNNNKKDKEKAAAASSNENKNNNNNNNTEDDEEIAMFEQLKELPYTELDLARFCLCALWELAEKGIFDKNTGELTPLAKRDMKKALSDAGNNSAATSSTASTNINSAAASGAAAATNSKAVIGTGSRGGAKTQKNLRALLEEECSVSWPHTPVDKAVIFTIVNDPAQPRHKPLFKATVEFPLLKKMKVEGEWAPTKRDAENSAADKSLPTVRRLLKK